MNLFVYGSLKKGCFNHDRFGFGSTARLLGNGIVDGVSLVRLGNLPYPHAFINDGGQVFGEVYELENTNIIDALERMERGAGYVPLPVQVHEGDGVGAVEATMYVADDWTETHRLRDKDGQVQGEVMSEWREAG